MRFAGQRFRAPSQSQGRFSTPSGSVGKFNYRYQPQGLPQSRAAMPEVNAGSFTKTQEPDFNIGDFSEPEFRA